MGSHYVSWVAISMCFFLHEIACHHAGPSGQTLTQQTSSPSGEMNGSRLQWSNPLWWMTPLSCNQDSTYLDTTGHSRAWITSRPTKVTVHPVKRSGALQQPTYALVANTKWCHILSTAADSPSYKEGAAATALRWWCCYQMAEDIRLVNALDNNYP